MNDLWIILYLELKIKCNKNLNIKKNMPKIRKNKEKNKTTEYTNNDIAEKLQILEVENILLKRENKNLYIRNILS